jgi:hypothetical protein
MTHGMRNPNKNAAEKYERSFCLKNCQKKTQPIMSNPVNSHMETISQIGLSKDY